MFLNTQKGFSLMELMVAVTIIAALSVIAVPSYKTFQAKARQKEGFNLLNGYYAAAIAARTEFGYFPGNIVGTGFAPVGELTYRLRANNNLSPHTGLTAFNDDPTCFRTFETCNCGGNCPAFKTWIEGPIGTVGSQIGIWSVNGGGCPTMAALSISNNAFIVGVAAVISTTAATGDRYYMNEAKNIEMCQDGLK